MSNIVPASIRNDFEIRPSLYFPGIGFVLLGLTSATIVDGLSGNQYLFFVDVANIVVIVGSIILILAKKISYSQGFATGIYSGALNYMMGMLQILAEPSGNLTWKVTYLMFLAVVFMAAGGFIVTKNASLVFGSLLLIVVVLVTFIHNDINLLNELAAIVPAILGFTFVIYYYRSSLERLIANLHDVNSRIAAQRDEMKLLKEAAEHSLSELQRAQTRIIAQEKLASLGALTAGIAHEIKNPLNFITNFSESSIELMDELSMHFEKCNRHLTDLDREDVDYLLGELRQNMRDIKEHGRRGDHIVKSMLMHSRAGSSTFTQEDLNSLAEECQNLAYHGLRAQDSAFQAQREFVAFPDLGDIDIVRGDISRVLLNLCNNAFYSVNKKRLLHGTGYRPLVRVSIVPDGKFVKIELWDNGVGIPAGIREKLFMPFFTTKPTGEGTGLGLSMSHEIIVKEHCGSIHVESEEGEWAQFIIRIPKTAAMPAVGGVN